MKNIFKIITFVALSGVLFTACGEEPYDMEDGGALKANVNAPLNVSFVYGITPSLSWDMGLTDNGNGVSSIVMSKRLETAMGDSETVTIDVTSGTFSQSLAELFADVPVDGSVLTEDDLTPGDKWVMSYVITLADGTVLTPYNETTVSFSCPLFADFTGTYSIVDVTGSAFGVSMWGAGPVEVVAVDDFDRSFDAVYLPAFGIGNGPETFQFKLECQLVKPAAGQGSGLGCGGAGLSFGPSVNYSSFDPNDDSVIEITFFEGGACGVDDFEVIVQLVKE